MTIISQSVRAVTPVLIFIPDSLKPVQFIDLIQQLTRVSLAINYAYEHIKELVVHGAFGFMLGTMLCAYGYLIYSGIRWVVKTVEKHMNKKSEKEGETNVCD